MEIVSLHRKQMPDTAATLKSNGAAAVAFFFCQHSEEYERNMFGRVKNMQAASRPPEPNGSVGN